MTLIERTGEPNTPLSIPEATVGGHSIKHVEKPANVRLSTANSRCQMFGQESRIIEYANRTTWHELSSEKDGVWMTDLPCEQAQMESCVEAARGRVLIGGLGIGLAPALLAKNPDVETITIVEQSAEIIELVAHTLPDRVEVIHEDLFVFLTDLKQDTETPGGDAFFDFGLYDIWQGDGESTFFDMVVPLRQLSSGLVSTVACWNEDVMRGQLANSLANRFAALCEEWDYTPQSDYLRALAETIPSTATKNIREVLLETKDDKYLGWSRQFLVDVDEGELDKLDAEALIFTYCQIYGRAHWESTWSEIRGSYY